MPNKSSISI
jgi:hypothetical protein